MRIGYANGVMRIMWNTKQRRSHSKRRNYLLNATYYKLWAGKHFAYYIIGQGAEGHGAGSTMETLS